MSRILITGSRDWSDVEAIRTALTSVNEGDMTLVSGGCPTGADAMAERIAADLGWRLEIHPADWKQHGRKAGFVRNSEMVSLGADKCFAFILDNSKGASMTLKIARAAGIPFHLISVSSMGSLKNY